VGTARLTCGQPIRGSPSAQLKPKREDLSSSIRLFEFLFVG